MFLAGIGVGIVAAYFISGVIGLLVASNIKNLEVRD